MSDHRHTGGSSMIAALVSKAHSCSLLHSVRTIATGETINHDLESSNDDGNVIIFVAVHRKVVGASFSMPKKSRSKPSKKPKTKKTFVVDNLYNKRFGGVHSKHYDDEISQNTTQNILVF